ncbi:MAG: hypothetical protein LBF08_03450 [Dysgonamonadaceae bacterium]|jgi:hypothetical protein|nr:hypothetical protein [Dysgonamonadaceae bacterium]
MKKVLLLFVFASLLTACEYSYTEKFTYQINEPVFMSETAFRSSVKVTNEKREIDERGKICFYNGYLFISEPMQGVHILDNRDPSQPKNVGFIELLGNADIAVKNNKLYADSYVDLVWFDISDPAAPRLEGRLENAFPEALPIVDNGYACDRNMIYNDNGQRKSGIVVGWTLKERDGEYYGIPDRNGWDIATAENGGAMSAGANGSMSRFSLYGQYLYAVINYQMFIFDLSEAEPVNKGSIGVGDVETIFSYKDKMFLGTPTGMSIYSVENPLEPEYCSQIWHVLGCDPVVVDNDLAYVTVHSGNFCGQNNDELFIVDVKDVCYPVQLVSYKMTNPKGLGIDKGVLFLCDDGLKVFRIGDDPQTLIANQILHLKGMDGYDLIPYDDVLMMIADNGLYQYDYSDLEDIRALSVISVGR